MRITVDTFNLALKQTTEFTIKAYTFFKKHIFTQQNMLAFGNLTHQSTTIALTHFSHIPDTIKSAFTHPEVSAQYRQLGVMMRENVPPLFLGSLVNAFLDHYVKVVPVTYYGTGWNTIITLGQWGITLCLIKDSIYLVSRSTSFTIQNVKIFAEKNISKDHKLTQCAEEGLDRTLSNIQGRVRDTLTHATLDTFINFTPFWILNIVIPSTLFDFTNINAILIYLLKARLLLSYRFSEELCERDLSKLLLNSPSLIIGTTLTYGICLGILTSVISSLTFIPYDIVYKYIELPFFTFFLQLTMHFTLKTTSKDFEDRPFYHTFEPITFLKMGLGKILDVFLTGSKVHLLRGPKPDTPLTLDDLYHHIQTEYHKTYLPLLIRIRNWRYIDFFVPKALYDKPSFDNDSILNAPFRDICHSLITILEYIIAIQKNPINDKILTNANILSLKSILNPLIKTDAAQKLIKNVLMRIWGLPETVIDEVIKLLQSKNYEDTLNWKIYLESIYPKTPLTEAPSIEHVAPNTKDPVSTITITQHLANIPEPPNSPQGVDPMPKESFFGNNSITLFKEYNPTSPTASILNVPILEDYTPPQPASSNKMNTTPYF
jgi:hypothetical protein